MAWDFLQCIGFHRLIIIFMRNMQKSFTGFDCSVISCEIDTSWKRGKWCEALDSSADEPAASAGRDCEAGSDSVNPDYFVPAWKSGT